VITVFIYNTILANYIHLPPRSNFITPYHLNHAGEPIQGEDIHIFTIEEVTQYVKEKLCSDPNLADIWIAGEISNFVHHTSGHFYFTLKDASSQLPCAMFRWANESLKFELADGQKIIARGKIDVYKPQGRYNFVVSEVHPKGMGELYLKYLQLKDKLDKEGLFDVQYKKPIPRYPRTIGVITSSTGAAVRDIINITGRRFPYSRILVIPTLVQGEKAAADIVRAIELVNAQKAVDVAIVGRGGGSIEDLWPFNEESVARAIFDSQVPIISAVGHETDFVIADFTADIRAPTPSAAAEIVVPDRKELARHIAMQREAAYQSLCALLRLQGKHMEGILGALKPSLLMDRILQFQQTSDALTSRIVTHMEHSLDMLKGRYSALNEMLDAVSPLATLNRGYSITMKLPEEVVVDTVRKIKLGEDVRIIVSDGELRCSVMDLVKKDVAHAIGKGNDKQSKTGKKGG
jgi:exodeoxyribonuclease VII large subunit